MSALNRHSAKWSRTRLPSGPGSSTTRAARSASNRPFKRNEKGAARPPISMTNTTQALSERIVITGAETIPDDIVLTAKACLLDTLGVALIGANEPLVNILRQTHASFGGAPQATLVGSGTRAPLPDAALINGAAAHALDFDD